MNIKQYILNNKTNQTELAKICVKNGKQGIHIETLRNAIKNNFIIINGTVYSPRFEIDESKLNEVKNDN